MAEIKCHYPSGCSESGIYICRYESTYTHEGDKIKKGLEFKYGSCEKHISYMRQNPFLSMYLISETKLEPVENNESNGDTE